jgi:hypothetical protein
LLLMLLSLPLHLLLLLLRRSSLSFLLLLLLSLLLLLLRLSAVAVIIAAVAVVAVVMPIDSHAVQQRAAKRKPRIHETTADEFVKSLFGLAFFFGRCDAVIHIRTVWPSGLRRWLKAPVRKGVGSNPTAVIA